MTITAKFSTICPCCNERIEAGTKVEWTKGSKARHIACAGAAIPSVVSSERVYVRDLPRRRSRGRWTGCSCGSIEDHPRDSDCASCQHDY